MACRLIDAVVVDYDTKALAKKCIASLGRSDLVGTIDYVDAKKRGLSYSRAVNNSFKGTLAPYVLALNADTRMLESPDVVVDIFEKYPEVAVVGPRQVNSQRLITHAGIFGTNEMPQHRFWMMQLDDVDEACNEYMLDCVTVSGSVYFARRSVWEELGGFLDTPHFYEETWFSYLARHKGHRVVYTGATTWIHEFNQTPLDPNWRVNRAAESQAIFRAACKREGIACN